MKQPKTAIVIPNWNGADFILDCLRSLEGQIERASIIIVDNGSVDNSLDLIRKHVPGVTILEQDRNYGFAGGVNIGIKYALAHKYDYIVLFNNDAVADKHWLSRLVAVADSHPRAGIVTGKLLRQGPDRLIDSTGDFYSVWGLPFPRGRDTPDTGQYDDQTVVFSGSGGASLYRSKMLREIGLFDEAFFAYYEDVDISFRAQLAGWKVLFEPQALAYHHVGGTSSKLGDFARYQTVKNFYYLYTKNMPASLYWKYWPRFVLSGLMIAANCWRRGQGGPWLKASALALVMFPVMLIKRWRIQGQRKVSASYIDSLLYRQLPPTHKTLLKLRQKFGRGSA